MPKRKIYDIDVDEMKRLYYEERLSIPLVAKHMGFPMHAIYAEMKRLGLPRRSKSEAQRMRIHYNRKSVSTEEMARLYFDEEKSLEDVGKEVGFSQFGVRNRLHQAGYQIRDSRESRLLRKVKGGRALIVFSSKEKDRIRHLYCVELLAMEVIAFRFSVSPYIIKRALLEMGVKLRTRKENQEIRRQRENENQEDVAENAGDVLDPSEVSEARIINLWDVEKLKLQEVAFKCSMSTVEVYNVLQQAGYLPVV